MMTKIRKATHADIEKICEIERSGAAHWNKQQFMAELKLDFAHFIVLEAKLEVIGYAVSWYVTDEIQLNNLVIKPEYRRKGMGTILLEHILTDSYTREPLPRSIILEVSNENRAAIQFYKKNGFIETGRRKNYYKHSDAILMIKEIPR